MVNTNSFRINFTPKSKHSEVTLRDPGFTAVNKPIVKIRANNKQSNGGRRYRTRGKKNKQLSRRSMYYKKSTKTRKHFKA
jgi:hypothetical protein